MSVKWNRRFELTVDDLFGETVTLTEPLTLDINIVRNCYASASQATIRVMNLAPQTRHRLYKDVIAPVDIYRRIILRAGYEADIQLPLVFQGNILSCYSWREGVDWITEIQSYSGLYGMRNGIISTTLDKGYQVTDAMLNLIGAMPHVSPGAIGDFSRDTSARGLPLEGNPYDRLSELVGPKDNIFIDNEVCHVLKENDYVQIDVPTFSISSDTGLLETPRRSEHMLEIPILFEPHLNIGQFVEVKSLEQIYNGNYVVLGIAHNGVISEAVNGRLVTVVTCYTGVAPLHPVRSYTNL